MHKLKIAATSVVIEIFASYFSVLLFMLITKYTRNVKGLAKK